jgi:hypothetical protein
MTKNSERLMVSHIILNRLFSIHRWPERVFYIKTNPSVAGKGYGRKLSDQDLTTNLINHITLTNLFLKNSLIVVSSKSFSQRKFIF